MREKANGTEKDKFILMREDKTCAGGVWVLSVLALRRKNEE